MGPPIHTGPLGQPTRRDPLQNFAVYSGELNLLSRDYYAARARIYHQFPPAPSKCDHFLHPTQFKRANCLQSLAFTSLFGFVVAAFVLFCTLVWLLVLFIKACCCVPSSDQPKARASPPPAARRAASLRSPRHRPGPRPLQRAEPPPARALFVKILLLFFSARPLPDPPPSPPPPPARPPTAHPRTPQAAAVVGAAGVWLGGQWLQTTLRHTTDLSLQHVDASASSVAAVASAVSDASSLLPGINSTLAQARSRPARRRLATRSPQPGPAAPSPASWHPGGSPGKHTRPPRRER